MNPDERARLVSASIVNDTPGRKIRYATFQTDSKTITRLGSGTKLRGLYAVKTRDGILILNTTRGWCFAHCRSWREYHDELRNLQSMQKSLETK